MSTMTPDFKSLLHHVVQGIVRTHVHLGRFAFASWLCLFPILTMVLGNLLLVLVAQGQDALASFIFFDNKSIFQHPRARVQYILFLTKFVTWALCVWCMSRAVLDRLGLDEAQPQFAPAPYNRFRRQFPLALAYLCLFPATFASVLLLVPTARVHLYLLAGAHIALVYLVAGPFTPR